MLCSRFLASIIFSLSPFISALMSSSRAFNCFPSALIVSSFSAFCRLNSASAFSRAASSCSCGNAWPQVGQVSLCSNSNCCSLISCHLARSVVILLPSEASSSCRNSNDFSMPLRDANKP